MSVKTKFWKYTCSEQAVIALKNIDENNLLKIVKQAQEIAIQRSEAQHPSYIFIREEDVKNAIQWHNETKDSLNKSK